MIGDAGETVERAVVVGQSERNIKVRNLRVAVFTLEKESPFLRVE